jgi:hypothetical protein
MGMKIYLTAIVLLTVVVASCVKTEPVSPVPEITFKRFEVFYAYDTLLEQYIPVGELEFSFIDGDADIGMYEEDIIEDTTGWDERNYNVFLTPYQKIDTLYYLIEPDSSKPPPYYTIWHDSKLDRVGQNKTIKGDITLTLNDLPEFDTIRYEFFIRDRAGNESNLETTTDVSTKPIQPIF